MKLALVELSRFWNAASTLSFGVPVEALVRLPSSATLSEPDPQPLIPTAAARPKPARVIALERVVTVESLASENNFTAPPPLGDGTYGIGQ